MAEGPIRNATDLARYLGEQFPEVGPVKMRALVRLTFRAINESLAEQCAAGEARPRVNIRGFGTFYGSWLPRRTAPDPHTGGQRTVGEGYQVRWRPALRGLWRRKQEG